MTGPFGRFNERGYVIYSHEKNKENRAKMMMIMKVMANDYWKLKAHSVFKFLTREMM